MSLPVTALKGVKVYNLSAGKTLPQWLEESHKKKFSLRYSTDFRSRIELIQDFSFPAASYRLKATRDGKYLIASGTYPPQVKVFELDQLAQKCERHLDGEVRASMRGLCVCSWRGAAWVVHGVLERLHGGHRRETKPDQTVKAACFVYFTFSPLLALMHLARVWVLTIVGVTGRANRSII
jgi:hypothetical protein